MTNKRLSFALALLAAVTLETCQVLGGGAKGGGNRAAGHAHAGGAAHHAAPHPPNQAMKGKANASKAHPSAPKNAMKSNGKPSHGPADPKSHHAGGKAGTVNHPANGSAKAAHSHTTASVNNASNVVRRSHYSRAQHRYYYARRGHRYYRRLLAAAQRPSFVRGPDQVVAVNSGQHTAAPWATFISAGRSYGARGGGALRFHVTRDTQPGLFRTPPRVSAAGVLTFTPAPGKTGTATITLVLRAGSGRSSRPQSFQISVGS
jgi:hypothetical protein